jgi:hypothetical protein
MVAPYAYMARVALMDTYFGRNMSHRTQYAFGNWASILALYQGLTDARAAGPLPDNSAPVYGTFVKDIGDHQGP